MYEVSLKVSRISGNCGISEKWTIQPKISETTRGNSYGMEIPSTKFSKILVYLARLSSFPEFPENSVSFVTRNFWKFESEFLYWLESAPKSSRSCDAKDSPSSLKLREFTLHKNICATCVVSLSTRELGTTSKNNMIGTTSRIWRIYWNNSLILHFLQKLNNCTRNKEWSTSNFFHTISREY